MNYYIILWLPPLIACGVYVLVGIVARRRELRAVVFSKLDSDKLMQWTYPTPEQIARDLARDTNYTAHELTPYVYEWLNEREFTCEQ
jgi:hypothetical protein